jgi:hypothetical protein
VTERIGLLTNVLLAPLYHPVLLAKVTACLDQISAGRLTLGVGVGGRADDFQLVERPFSDRGRPGPGGAADRRPGRAGRPPGGPLGGRLHHRRRPAGDGRRAIQEFKAAYGQAGGTGTPRIVALTYYSLGEERTEASLRNLRT